MIRTLNKFFGIVQDQRNGCIRKFPPHPPQKKRKEKRNCKEAVYFLFISPAHHPPFLHSVGIWPNFGKISLFHFCLFFSLFKVRENQLALPRWRSESWLYQMLPWNCRRLSQVIIGTEEPGLQVRTLLVWR